MTAEVLAFLQGDPVRISLFEALEVVVKSLGQSSIDVKKTQISWGNPRKFAILSLPRKASLKHGLILTFGLDHRVEHSRIIAASEPYPNRWTHHVPLLVPEDVDDTLLGWLTQAYLFSLSK